MNALTIGLEENAEKASVDAIGEGLTAYNGQFAEGKWNEFTVPLKDHDGRVRGGILAGDWGGMLFIKWFWVDEALRGQGWGRKIIAVAEDEGRKRGCRAVWLDTFEFQARPFYEKIGYRVFGELDYPQGFKRYFMTKEL